MPIRDLKAITQENKAVKQDVVPIRNRQGQVIAVLIREKDVSESISTSKKLDEVARTAGQLTETTIKEGSVAMKEIHHRIKNNLQTVASILNIQARRSSSEELRNALKENISRVLSIAAIHDILTKNGID
jgi:two-component sensor histidine kinase